jgi:hypothetical protein
MAAAEEVVGMAAVARMEQVEAEARAILRIK